VDPLATKTMAEIYLRQGHLQEAYEILKALFEKDPSNIEIQVRLKELSEQFNPSHPFSHPPVCSDEEKIRILKSWLANIRSQRKR